MKIPTGSKSINTEEDGVNFWPSFVDMLTQILIIVFLIAFIRQLSSEEFLQIKQRKEQFKKEFEKEFHSEIENKTVSITQEGNLQQLTFSSKILFTSGSAEISLEGLLLLGRLAKIFNKTIAKKIYKQIQVEGHTDDTPIGDELRSTYASNWELSAQRAINVIKYFTERASKKLRPELFSATAYSFYKPKSAENKENRRIEIRMVYIDKLN